MYQQGQGTPINYPKAMKYFEKGALKGDASSMASIGFLVERGLGVPKDPNLAVNWYEKAIAKQPTLKRATFLLGMTFARGIGNSVDLPKAEEFFQLSIFNGDDFLSWVGWWEKLSQEGQLDMNSLLGTIFEKGLLGIPQNTQKAIEYFSKGSKDGDQFATQRLQMLLPSSPIAADPIISPEFN
jgi:hypothetical protein